MSKKPRDVPKDIVEVLKNVQNGVGKPIPEELYTEFASNIVDKLHKLFTPRTKERRAKTLYASEVGNPCMRKTWYSYHYPAAAEDLHVNALIKFLYGDILEELLLLLAAMAGHEVGNRQRLIEYILTDGWTVRGRIDATIDGHVIDVKSASSLGFQKFLNGLKDDPFGYKTQLGIYGPTAESGFLVINKETGALTFTDTGAEVDQQSSLAQCNKLVNALEKGDLNPPDRAFDERPDGSSGNMKLGTECSYCLYKKHCWATANGGKGLRLFMYSGNRPVYLTKVVREPKVPEVIGYGKV